MAYAKGMDTSKQIATIEPQRIKTRCRFMTLDRENLWRDYRILTFCHERI